MKSQTAGSSSTISARLCMESSACRGYRPNTPSSPAGDEGMAGYGRGVALRVGPRLDDSDGKPECQPFAVREWLPEWRLLGWATWERETRVRGKPSKSMMSLARYGFSLSHALHRRLNTRVGCSCAECDPSSLSVESILVRIAGSGIGWRQDKQRTPR